jgi:hypothetical protein
MFGQRKKLVSPQIEEIKSHLETNDYWSFVIEWGVGKETYIKISKSSKHESFFDVLVELDHRFQCSCPAIERAVEFADIYSDLIYKLYMSNGWPSWHSKHEL